MDLMNKKVIILGERDGVQAAAIAACATAAGATVALLQDQCFV